MKAVSILLSLCLALVLLPNNSRALTIKRPETEEKADEKASEMMEIAAKLNRVVPEYEGEGVIQLASLINNLKDDEETKQVIEMIRSGDIAFDNDEEVKNAEHKELVTAMIILFDELKAIEVLFLQDPLKAVEVVHGEGMIKDEEALKYFQQNPGHLQNEMTQQLYMSFIRIAHAAGYL